MIKNAQPFWKKKCQKTSGGIFFDSHCSTGTGVAYLPSNPNALVEMLPLLMEIYKAGNTGVVDRIVAICDEIELTIKSDDLKIQPASGHTWTPF